MAPLNPMPKGKTMLTRFTLVILFLISISSSSALLAGKVSHEFAQQISEQTDQSEQIIDSTLEAMMQQLSQLGFTEEDKELTAALKKVILKNMPKENLKKATIRFYEENFSDDELKQISEVMSKPVMQKQMHLIPNMQKQIMASMMEDMLKINAEAEKVIVAYAAQKGKTIVQ